MGFLFSTSALCGYCAYLTAFVFVPWHLQGLSVPSQFARSTGSAVPMATKVFFVVAQNIVPACLGVFCAAVSLVLFCFAVYHLSLIYSNITTYEEYKWERYRRTANRAIQFVGRERRYGNISQNDFNCINYFTGKTEQQQSLGLHCKACYENDRRVSIDGERYAQTIWHRARYTGRQLADASRHRRLVVERHYRRSSVRSLVRSFVSMKCCSCGRPTKTEIDAPVVSLDDAVMQRLDQALTIMERYARL